MKGKGEKCPHCGKQTFHDKGSYRQCSSCKYVGWSWQQKVAGVGKGKGNYCPNCGNQTLHKIVKLTGGNIVRRCGVCGFSGVEPT